MNSSNHISTNSDLWGSDPFLFSITYGPSGLLFIIAIIIICVVCRSRRQLAAARQNRARSRSAVNPVTNPLELNPLETSDVLIKELKDQDPLKLAGIRNIPMLHIEYGEAIGRGAINVIYSGSFFGQPVAIKKFNCNELLTNTNAIEDFCQEAIVWSSLTFRNIVQLYGVCCTATHKCMVMERCFISVADILRKNFQFPNLPWERRLTIGYEFMSGLKYMHTQGVLHRDLKSMNILLTSPPQSIVKICDFGCAAFGKKVPTHAGTPHWMAPEAFKDKYTVASEVYSVGIIMWELATRKPPFYQSKSNVLALANEIQDGNRPSMDDIKSVSWPNDNLRSEYIELMKACWHQNSEQRPKVVDVGNKFQAMLDELQGSNTAELTLRKKESSRFLKLGRDAYSKGEFRRSSALFKQSKNRFATEEAYIYLWNSLMEQKEHDAAEKVADQFIKAFPDSPTGFLKKGDVQARLKKYETAVDLYKEGLLRDQFNDALRAKIQKYERMVREQQQRSNDSTTTTTTTTFTSIPIHSPITTIATNISLSPITESNALISTSTRTTLTLSYS